MLNVRLKQLRENMGFSQEQVAEKIGISRNSVYNYETGERKPDSDILIKYADLFDVSIDYLVGRSNFINYHQEFEYRKRKDLELSKLESRKIERSLSSMPDDEAKKFYHDSLTVSEMFFSIIDDLASYGRYESCSANALDTLREMLTWIMEIKKSLKNEGMYFYVDLLKLMIKGRKVHLLDAEIEELALDKCKKYFNRFLNWYICAIFDFDKMKLKEEIELKGEE